MKRISLALFRGNLYLAVGYYPEWKIHRAPTVEHIGIFHAHYNHWTPGYPCLDMSFGVWKFDVNVTCFKMPFQRDMGIWHD